MKKEIEEILKQYSCWTLKKGYGCIPELTDQILSLIIEKLPKEKKIDKEFSTDERRYPHGFNQCLVEIKQLLKSK